MISETCSGASMQCQCPTSFNTSNLAFRIPFLIILQLSKGAILSSSPTIINVGHLIFSYSGGIAVAITLHRDIYPSGGCDRINSLMKALAKPEDEDAVAAVGIVFVSGSIPSELE